MYCGLEMITPIRGRKLIYNTTVIGIVSGLEMITPIRGRELKTVTLLCY